MSRREPRRKTGLFWATMVFMLNERKKRRKLRKRQNAEILRLLKTGHSEVVDISHLV